MQRAVYTLMFLVPLLFAAAEQLDTRRFETKLESGAITMWANGTNLWTYLPQGEEGKPYFAALNVPGTGESLTAVHPEDHRWHLGLWFSWKFINGYNFWEPQSNAVTRVIKQSIATGADKVLRAEAVLAYRANGVELLREERKVEVVTALDGNYTITWEGRFSAREWDVELACTPAARGKSGEWAVGGYAGLTWRLPDNDRFEYRVVNEGGAVNVAACGEGSRWLDIYASSKLSKARAHIRFSDLPGNPRHPVAWFVRHNPTALKGRGYYLLGPGMVFHAPYELPAGKSFTLKYQIAVKRER